MMINVARMNELLDLIESCHKMPFWEAIFKSIEDGDLSHSGFSEFETYGNFMFARHPLECTLILRRRDRGAKKIIGENPSDEQLDWYGKYYEVIGIEHWDKSTILADLTKHPAYRILSPKWVRKIFNLIQKIKRLFG